jgi:hypothetical protein
MHKITATILILFLALSAAGAQIVIFGFNDTGFEKNLHEINLITKFNMAEFSLKVANTWGTSEKNVLLGFSRGLNAYEVYLVIALARLSGRQPIAVITMYEQNRSKGWGALAKSLGIKPGSKSFKKLKDTTATFVLSLR